MNPTLEDFLMEGLSLKEACMALEATASCGIEGITLDKKGFKSLCKSIIEGRKDGA